MGLEEGAGADEPPNGIRKGLNAPRPPNGSPEDEAPPEAAAAAMKADKGLAPKPRRSLSAFKLDWDAADVAGESGG